MCVRLKREKSQNRLPSLKPNPQPRRMFLSRGKGTRIRVLGKVPVHKTTFTHSRMGGQRWVLQTLTHKGKARVGIQRVGKARALSVVVAKVGGGGTRHPQFKIPRVGRLSQGGRQPPLLQMLKHRGAMARAV